MFHAFSFEDTKDTYNLDKYYKKISECLDGKYKVFWDTLYDEYGKDIVCSAVSSIATTTVNGILSL